MGVPDLIILGPLPPAEQLDTLQATCRQFARLIDFVLSFDAVKMCTPALQNDFSFYRRAMSREVCSLLQSNVFFLVFFPVMD